jgi:hypothetical protein
VIEQDSALIGSLVTLAIVLALFAGGVSWIVVLGLRAIGRLQGVQVTRRDGRLEVTAAVVATGKLGAVAEELELAQVTDSAERAKRPLLSSKNGAARSAEQPS